MKLIHLSDLHIGKRVNEYSMIEDQKYILDRILDIIDIEQPKGIIIAGDVYDKTIPPAEAVQVFDDFLVSLANRNLQVFIISGNHDSPERLSFGSRLMDSKGIHFSPVYNGNVEPIQINDEFGLINIFMLPFIKPANVRRFFDQEINTYTDAVSAAIKQMNINTDNRNLIITHQFVTGALRTDSEEISVGGTDNVDATVFKDFDYVALGHIHRAQKCLSENIRYCGTPLKYSFSEAKDCKSVTVLELKEKGSVLIKTVELKPLRDMVEIKGKYNDIMLKSFYENTTYQHDYIHITLTDEDDIPDAVSKLRTVYYNLMKIDYDNQRTRSKAYIDAVSNIERKSPLELFSDLYELQNNQTMTQQQKEFVESLIDEIWEDK